MEDKGISLPGDGSFQGWRSYGCDFPRYIRKISTLSPVSLLHNFFYLLLGFFADTEYFV